ncbi:MAG: radical SAM protein [Patescibacteria group bacterium]
MTKNDFFSYLNSKINVKKLDDWSNFPPLSWFKKVFVQRMINYDFPQHIFLESTSVCNFNCRICARITGKTLIGSMDFDFFKKIVNEAANYGPRNFSLHLSGEPLINPRLMEMAKYIKEKNRRNSISLTTNGSLLSPTIAEQIVRIGIDKVSISFLSPEAQTYREKTGVDKLDEVEKNVKELIKIKGRAAKPKIFVRMIVDDDTQSQAKNFISKWQNEKVIIELRDQHNYGGNVAKSHVRKNHKRYPCYHLWFSPAVHFNGDVSICCDDLARVGVLGNASDQTVNKIWNSELIKKYRQLHLQGKYDQISICAKCDVWNMYADIFFFWQKK